MSDLLHKEQLLFEALLLPERNSWLQQYFRLSRWLTIPILLIMLIGLILGGEQIPMSIWGVILIGVPFAFWGLHLIFIRIVAKAEIEKWFTHKFFITHDTLIKYNPDSTIEEFPLEILSDIRWIYSGYERAFFPQGKYFNGSQNELLVKFRDRKFALQFRLTSKKHYQQLLMALDRWEEYGVEFEEFNRTSGLPVKSHRFKVGN